MSSKTSARRGFSGHRPTPPQPQNVLLTYVAPNAWNIDWDDPAATNRTEVLLKDVTAAPFVVASTTTIPGSGEADLVLIPTPAHTYSASVRFSLNGEPGPSAISNSVTP